VAPALFAIAGFGFDNLAVALFATFGSFSLLVFADLGGPHRRRFGGFLVLTAVGAGLVALGTFLSEWVVAAVVGMAVVGFAVNLVGVFGGYYAVSGVAMTLAFVLAESVGPTGTMGERVLGWAVGGLTAAIAAAVLWPVEERRSIATAMAEAAHRLAQLLRTLAPATGAGSAGVADATRDAAEAMQAARHRFRTSPFRPAGPSVHDRAVVYAIDELPWLLDQARVVAAHVPVGRADADLLAASADALDDSAAALEARRAPDRSALVAAREVHLDAVVAGVDHHGGPAGDRSTLQRLDTAFGPRLLSFGALSFADHVAIATGHHDTTGTFATTTAAVARGDQEVRGAARTLAFHLHPASARFRSALRVGLALGIAIAVALVGGVEHAFWVALGTLSVLRGSALATGYTVIQSIAGTVAGFVLAAGVVSITDADWFLWIVLPIAVFLAAYTPTAVHFVVGQASFTIFVVVLFNLIEPQGWRVGLVRVQDVAIGVLVSLVVSIVLWPRGASAQLRSAAAAGQAAGARFAADALEAWLGRPTDVERARLAALAAARRADEAFGGYLEDRGRRRIALADAVQLVHTGLVVRLAGEALKGLAERGAGVGSCTAAADVLTSEADELAETFARLGIAPPPDQSELDRLAQRDGQVVATCLDELNADADPHHLVRVAWSSEFLRHLWALARTGDQQLRAAAAATAGPWWKP
jgi:uncharacterized membrane protein YccC